MDDSQVTDELQLMWMVEYSDEDECYVATAFAEGGNVMAHGETYGEAADELTNALIVTLEEYRRALDQVLREIRESTL